MGPNTWRVCMGMAKLEKLLSIRFAVCSKLIPKRDSNFFAAFSWIRIKTADSCLIRARQMAQLAGSDGS
jgi:hypothetical protein